MVPRTRPPTHGTGRGRAGWASRRFVLGLGLVAGALAIAGCLRLRGGEIAARHGAGATGSVRLAPDPAFAAARIEAIVDGPRAGRTTFEWWRDGERIDGADGPTLAPTRFSKGQTIAVVVRPADPAATGPVWSDTIVVENTPPRIAGVTLQLAAASDLSEVRAVIEASDPDGDALAHAVRWFRNGVRIEGAAAGPVLAMAGLQRGDRIEAEVVATDGEADSPPARSEPLRIENLPPRFTSQPRAPRADDAAFAYRPEAVDPDGDPLRFELVEAPDGMTLADDGTIVWPLPSGEARARHHPVRVRVSDARGGESVQAFSLHLESPVPR
jgi:hypothetical protein